MTTDCRAAAAVTVRRIAHALAVERNGVHALALPAELDGHARLEADLGLHSLERLELACRLRLAGLPVDPAAIVGAESIGDVLTLAEGGACARPPAAEVRFPDDPIWHPLDTPSRSRFFTARVAVLVSGVTAAGRLLLLKRRGKPARRVLRRAARWVLRRSGCTLDVRGLEHLQAEGPVVIVANHESYVDTVVMLAAVPRDAKLVANEGLPKAPLLGAAIAAAEHLVVNRAAVADPQRAVDEMVATLRSGVSLIVYPEGTIAPGPGMLPFRLGAFAAAVATGRPVVPVTITGTRKMLPFDTWLLARAPLGVEAHPPLVPEGDGWPAVVRLAAAARERVGAARPGA